MHTLDVRLKVYQFNITIELFCDIHGSFAYNFYPKIFKEIHLEEFLKRVIDYHMESHDRQNPTE